MFKLLAVCALAAPLLALAEGGSLGDPTRPTALNEVVSTKVGDSGPRWRLQSTRVSAERRVAVINGKTLRVGDVVDGATLVDIRSNGVSLHFGRGRVELPLVPQTAQIRKGEK